MKKTCNLCKQEKNLSEFRKDKTKSSGYQSRCKVCARAFINANYEKYREKTLRRNLERSQGNRQKLSAYKAEKTCTFCGEDEKVCLEFHHINPDEKSFQLSRITTQSWDTITEEVQKCIVVCRNCHAKIHAGILHYGPVV